MPRPRRSGWSPVTLTLSNEVIGALRARAAVRGREIGNEADAILRATLEPLFEKVEALKGDLPVRPLEAATSSLPSPSPARREEPSTVSALEPISAQATEPGGMNDAEPDFGDPEVRAIYEKRFLDEVLAEAKRRGWESFEGELADAHLMAEGMGGGLILASTLHDEIECWIRAQRVTTRWKDHVWSILSADGEFMPSIFNGRLGPDDFFVWEQPE